MASSGRATTSGQAHAVGRSIAVLAVIGAGVIAFGVSQAAGAASTGTRLEWLLIAAVGLLGVGLGLRPLMIRLEWSGDRLCVRLGPFRRWVSLTTLTAVGYRRSGRTAFYLLHDREGRKLQVQATLFARDDEWKPRILEAARRCGASVDRRAEKSLQHADGTGRGYLA